MKRSARNHRLFFTSLALASIFAAWSGCAKSGESTTGGNDPSTSSTGTGGSGGTGGDLPIDGGSGGEQDTGPCSYTEAEAHRVPLDIIFLIDVSGSMTGPKWEGTVSALTDFFYDPASIAIGAGIVYFPTSEPYDCNPAHYEILDVPIDALPSNAFALTNSLPFDATGVGTPTYGALKGALFAATAYQDAHPTHKVIVVLSTDGDPIGRGGKPISDIADVAASALAYNGVHTYVIGVAGSIVSNLDKIAAGGGTGAAYDITQSIDLFAAKMAEIRNVALGCDYEIPPVLPPDQLDPDEVNFTYTPKGMGDAILLPKADDLADCGGKPGWYFDSNAHPTKILLCPASCATIQSDLQAKISVQFGCKSIIN